MKIGKGDKVRFLNAIGGGVVSRVEGDRKVWVIDEDGFEVPSLISEVVIVEKSTGSSPQKSERVIEDFSEEEEVEYEETKEEGEPAVLLAFKKNDDFDGNVDVFLINDSNFFVLYVLGREENGEFNTVFSGQLEPNTKLLLDVMAINYIDSGIFNMQCLLFRKNYAYTKKEPVDVKINIKGMQLMKDSSFIKNDFFNEKVFLYYVVKNEFQKKLEEVTDKDIKEAIKEKVLIENKPSQTIKKSKNDIIEIDLHINELLDNTSGLSNKDMLDYQLGKFHEVLRQNAKNKNQRIVFIHGKGNGVLKSELLKALKHQYKTYRYQDASFREYGYGATMVII